MLIFMEFSSFPICPKVNNILYVVGDFDTNNKLVARISDTLQWLFIDSQFWFYRRCQWNFWQYCVQTDDSLPPPVDE